MSERGEVAVDVPFGNPLMTDDEKKALFRQAVSACRELLAKSGGRLLGLKTVEPTVVEGGPALKFLFAVEAPESNFFQRKSFAVDGRRG